MKVSLVGAGPGDPGLITVRGLDLVRQADVIIYDALANPSLLGEARPDAKLVYVGKIADQHSLPQDQINDLLVKTAREGKNVVRLKGGDPYIFGRGGEEAEFLASHGIPFEEVPGVSSAIAAPAYAGIPLTHRDYTSGVTILTGHEKYPQFSHDWQALAHGAATLVIVMGVKNLGEITANLIQGGLDASTSAAIIYKGTTPLQRVLIATLGTLAEEAQAQGFQNPSVVVVGKVVSLAPTLAWFSKKPLFGKKIVVTRAREQASQLARALEEQGASVIECPTIAIKPLNDYAAVDAAIQNIRSYGWIFFTSVNGVKYFWQRLEKAGLDSRSLCHAKVVAIGPATMDALRSHGVMPDFMPTSYVAEEVANQLVGQEGPPLAGVKALIPRAASAREVLPAELEAADMSVDVVPVYETVAGEGCGAKVADMLKAGQIDCVTFGSSSTVGNFLKIVPPQDLKQHPETALAAIGPVTAATLKENGLPCQIMPRDYTIPALVQAIVTYYQQDKAR